MPTLTEPGIIAVPLYVRNGPPQGQWTVAHLHTFPPEDGNRYEILDGVLVMTTQPHWEHQHAAARIVWALQDWSFRTDAGWVLVAPGIIFADDTAIAPDVVWVRHARLDRLLGADGKLHGAPDLVVKVLSPGKENEERDRATKLHLYARYGVAEYWIVDRLQRQVEAYRPDSITGTLVLAQVYAQADTLTSPILTGFACPIARLLG